MKKFKGLSLFACSGIGEFFLHENDIEVVVANELLDNRAKFYSFNYPESKMIQGDITHPDVFNEVMKSSQELDVDFLMASPPCQSFSSSGKMSEDDPKNSLIFKVIDAIKIISPKYSIIENVPNFFVHYIVKDGQRIKLLDLLDKTLGEEYVINAKIINTADYGTPQSRKRAIVLISRKDQLEWDFPEATTPVHKTVEQTIGHLPSLESGQKSQIPYHSALTHNERHILWMKHTPTGKSAFQNVVHFPKKEDGQRIKGFSNTYKRMEWNKPAPTITMANGVISSQENVHPGKMLMDGTYSDARALTILELILLTGLNDKWKIPKNAKDSLIRHVLGECVPPLLYLELTRFLKNA